jgi:hypothetical protein
MEIMYDINNLPPIRRDLLSNVPDVDYRDTFNKSALITKPFLDPDSKQTEPLFREAIESVISGRFSISETLSEVNKELNLIIND